MKKSTINKISLILSSAALTVSMGSLILVTIYSKPKTVILSATSLDPIIVAVNKEREKRNIPKLNESPVLNRSATDKACDMRDKNYFAHESPDGKTLWYFFAIAGIVVIVMTRLLLAKI